jgi:energy-coupling factor transporter ATP-binding protein EcfA2
VTQELLGQRLLKEKVVSKKQLDEAIERQRLRGGRLGHNLLALGYLTSGELDTFFRKDPQPPESVNDSGLDLSFIADLIMKHVLFMGEFSLSDICYRVKLPMPIVDEAVETLRREKFVQVKGAGGYTKASYRFSITGQGHNRAVELLEMCRYTGPAPVLLDEYSNMIEHQTIKHIVVSEESVRRSFSHLVISDKQLRRIGPAISSGKAIFLYGPPGNGKTTIAETMGRVLPETVYIPYAVIVGGQIISVFDAVNHVPAPPKPTREAIDERWILVNRPVIMTGGELTLRMLNPEFNTISKYYEAPLQMKANNGLFIIDDFGRQQVDAQNLINRWVVPLERRTDFMSLHTGMKFEIPFDQLVIFATNVQPSKLVDDAFLRRIRYKIKVDHPTEEQYEAIFKKVCEANGIRFKPEMLDYLLNNYYRRIGIRLNACHPRDIVDHIIDNAHYYNHPPELTKENIDDAWENYFVEV